MQQVTSLSDLEQFDPNPHSSGSRKRYLCPWCGGDKPQDSTHRCLSVDPDEGLYYCHRCGSRGRLGGGNFRLRTPEEHQAAEEKRRKQREEKQSKLTKEFKRSVAIPGTPGETYLLSRGISLYGAVHTDVRYTIDHAGRSAVLFPLRTIYGEPKGAQRRYLDSEQPRMKTLGFPKESIFIGHLASICGMHDKIAVTEAPIDALSLEELGMPAVACCGSSFPEYLPEYLKKMAIKSVYTASDADDPGDRAAESWAMRLKECGISAERLRPEGGKDWNDCIRTTSGRESLRTRLQAR